MLFSSDQNYIAEHRDFLSLVKIVESFRCYIEGATFEVITGNQVLNNAFSKRSSRMVAGWLEKLGHFTGLPAILKR